MEEIMMTLDFGGKKAIVFGAGSGIGRAVALQLADNGADVWACDIAAENVESVARDLRQYGNQYGFSATNVAVEEDVTAAFGDAKKEFGGIDIAVNSAGVFLPDDLLRAKAADIKRHLDINLFGVIHGCRIALEMMIAQGRGGKIVNVSSVGGRRGESGSPYYSLGKSGIINFTQSAAFTGAPHGVNVNAICPGIIRTPMWDVILEDVAGGDPDADKEALFQEIVEKRTPLGRAQTAEEMAYAVCFLCSQYADAIVGQALNVCGGDRMN
jgi:NAD(P)-dependent dehydrogenase (short-subunit alcohol dehydrogenase family)